jgi:hypothetical protein
MAQLYRFVQQESPAGKAGLYFLHDGHEYFYWARRSIAL